MEKVVFVDSKQGVFEKFGLKSFDDFFYYPGVEKIHKKCKRHVSALTLGDGPDCRVFFLKRFYKPHHKDIIGAWRNFGRRTSQAEVECANAQLLLSSGIDTYQPVCFGEQIRWGLERKSFLITEELQGQCFVDFISQNWLQLTRSQKERIIISIARLIRRTHDARISMPDMYVWHIFMEKNQKPDEWDFAVIDLHRMVRNVTDGDQQIRNLGRLDYSMLDKYFDASMRRLLIESYAGDDWPGGVAELAEKVKKYSDMLSSRRTPRPY